jgi:hypothetical protein
MLILTRKIGESVVIGDHIVVGVLEVNGTRIRLGIEAPPQWVKKWAGLSGWRWSGSVVGNTFPTKASDRVCPRRVSPQQVE